MKANILKKAGVKTEKEFYKKFPTMESFIKKHGDIAQFGGNFNLGTPPNFSVDATKGFNPPSNSFYMPAVKFNAYNPQGEQSNTALAKGIFEGAHSVSPNLKAPSASSFLNSNQFSSSSTPPTENSWSKVGGALGKNAGVVGDVISGIGALKAEKEAAKQAKQTRLVSDVSLQAAQSVDKDSRRQMQDTFSKQRNALLQPITGENFFPVNGVGTNVLAKNGKKLKLGGEIQNTYAPYTLYDDGGYEPLNDSNLKQYQAGGGIPWGDISHKATGMGQSLMGGQNAGGQIGGTVGKTLGNAILPGIGGAVGEFVGGMAGNVLDPYAKRIKKDQAATDRNMMNMSIANSSKNLQAQNQSYMEDGGYISNDWTPQVIAKFGDHSSQDIYDFAHEGMQSLRSGDNLRDYTAPNNSALQSYELGGELQTHWGGEAEPMSYNPYLPGTGETVMFKGQSHDDYDGNGNSGIGITYAGNPVEVERGEPMVELEEGGTINPETGEPQKSGVVYGNLMANAELLGDPNAKGKKYKNYVADLSKKENSQTKLIDSSAKSLNNLNPNNVFDKLKLNSLQANIQGGNMKLKDIADKKINAAGLQNAINNTAEEYGLIADDLAKGKVKADKNAQTKLAKFGGKFTQAQDGGNLTKENYDYLTALYDQAEKEGKGPTVEKFQREFSRLVPEKAKQVLAQYPPTAYGKAKGLPSTDVSSNYDQIFGKRTKAYRAALKEPIVSVNELKPVGFDNSLSNKINLQFPVQPTTEDVNEEQPETLTNPYFDVLNQMIPYMRPTDQEDLDPSQLYPEMYASSTNQLVPVQANFYTPELNVPYDISLQDQLNTNQSDYNAAQRMMGYNPAAQFALNAQKYSANQQVLGDQFRANQAIKDKVYGENRNILNDAKLKNLAIADQQYVRQNEALSKTKATDLEIIKSITDKYAKNKLENRQLGIMENLYNYRYDKDGRAVNMNPLQQVNIQGNNVQQQTEQAPAGYEYETILKKIKTKNAKNGSIVKAFKNF